MSPFEDFGGGLGVGFPRMSGDEPTRTQFMFFTDLFSPHERG